MLQFRNLAGRRETAAQKEKAVVLLSVKGGFSVEAELAKEMNISDKCFVAIQEDTATGTIYIGRGKDGVIARNEAGEPIKDGRGRFTFEKEGDGSFATENAGTISFNNAYGWKLLGGTASAKKVFTIGEGVEVSLEDKEGALYNTVLYPLVFQKDQPITERKKIIKSEAVVEEDSQAMVSEEAQDEEVATVSYGASTFDDEDL